MDTNIGTLNLTEIQIQNAAQSTKPTPFLGFSVHEDGTVIAVSSTEPSQGQVATMVDFLEAQPLTPIQSVAILNFDFKTLWGTIWAGALSQTGLINLPPYSTTIEGMWYFPNLSAIYPFMQALVAAGKGTQGDLTIIVDAFADQGIDITTIQ